MLFVVVFIIKLCLTILWLGENTFNGLKTAIESPFLESKSSVLVHMLLPN